MNTTTKKCFVVSPIGEDGTETRKRSDQVLRYIIASALEAHGFIVTRADKISEPGLITNQIVHRLLDDELVVADLTDNNANVFYEVAIRQAIQMPLVLLIRKGQKIPFDLAGFRTIPYDITDLESVELAKQELIRQSLLEVKKTTDQIESPIGIAKQLRNIRANPKGDSLYLAHLVEDIAALRNRISDMDNRLSSELNRLVTPVSRSFAMAVDFEKSLDKILDYATYDSQNTAKSKRHYEELLQSVLEDLIRLRAKVRNASSG